MIDRNSRDLVAIRLLQYVNSRATNDDLDDVLWDLTDRDRGVVAVSEMAWGLYDDTSTHRATGRHYLGVEARHEIFRWILFLDTDLEYEWPKYSFVKIDPFFLSLFTFGIAGVIHRSRWNRFVSSGPFEIWPFFRQEDLDSALRNPRRLRGPQQGEQVGGGNRLKPVLHL